MAKKLSADRLRGLMKPASPVAEPQKKASTRAKERRKRVKRYEKNQARLDSKIAAEVHTASLSDSPLFPDAKDAESFIKRLEEVAAFSQQHRREGHKALRQALAESYGAVIALQQLPKSEMHEALRRLHDQVSNSGAGRVNSADRVRLVLKSMIAYTNRKVDRAKITRDAQAINYALAHQIPHDEFVSRLSAKGESIQLWSKRYSDEQKAHRNTGSERRQPDVRAKWKSAPPTPPPAILAEFDRKRLTRSGTYVAVLEWDEEELAVRKLGRLADEGLDDDELDDIISAAQTVVPVSE